MDITNMLTELHADRDLVDQAILTLERLARGGAPRRGRLPKWLSTQSPAQPKRRGRPPGREGMSAANRKAQSKRMKQYWAERRKQKSK
jgi:hypothetical protein